MPLCPSCGAENPEGFRFCGSCGASLQPATHGEERKVVSILFVDLVGFTAQADHADPEDVGAILRPYHALLRREIDRWGGTLEKFVGDAVMAVFGAPVAREHDPERALRAAFRIIESLQDLNEANELDLEVRAGIDTGQALVTLGARPSEGEAMIAGDVVNTAARLQASAPTSGIVVGEATYRATSEAFDYVELEPIRLKGKADPVPVWQAIAARSSFGTDLERPTTPFVGRGDDLALLQQAYRRMLREQSIQLVTITGEPGVGKTRLVTELSTWVDDQLELVFWRQGRCLPYGDGVTFWALAEIVKAHTGMLESDDPEVARRKLAESVGAIIEDSRDSAWLITALSSLAGIEGDRALDREEAFGAWRMYLEAIATRRPLVLVIEDLHWADDGLLAFIEMLLDWSVNVACLVICTARPEFYERMPDWGGGKRNSSTVGLSPLSNEETALLVASLLRQAVLPADTQRVLLEHAGGNPLFAGEFTKMLIDRGTLKRELGTWTITPGSSITVPDSVHAIIASRLDTLPVDRKSLLQDAAVVGKVFWSGAVASMSGTDEVRVREVMHDLTRQELVREARRSSVDDQVEYAFWHTLVRDVTYEQIPRLSRVAKHQAAAAWIEQVSRDRIEDATELLAYHYTTALGLARASGMTDVVPDLEDQALRSLALAGDRVLYLDPPKAESYYRRALELTPDGQQIRPRMLLKLITTDMLSAEESEEVFERAVSEFRTFGDLHGAADAMARFARLVWQRGDVGRALALEKSAAEILEQEAPSSELANAYASHSFRLSASGDLRGGLAAANSALELARELDLPITVQDALQSRGIARCSSGDQEGLADLREALRMSLELGLVHQTVEAYINLSDHVWLNEGPRAAIGLSREAIDFWDRHGMGFHDWVTGELTWFLFDAGDWDELVEAAEAVLNSEDQASEQRQPGAMALTMRSLVDLHRGRTDRLAEAVPKIIGRVRGSDKQVLVPGLVVCALIEARRGNHLEASKLLSEIAEIRTELIPLLRTWFLGEIARVTRSIGEPQIARELVNGLEPGATRDRLAMLSARATLAEVDERTADAIAMHAEAAAGWQAYGNLPEEGFSLLSQGRCLLHLRRNAEAGRSLADARRVFVHLQASPYIIEIDKLLGRATA